MKNFAFILSLFAFCCLSAGANAGIIPDKWDIKVKYGIEWGYTATFIENYHANYFDPDDGYRIDNRYTRLYLYSNANIAAKIGIEMRNHYSATVLAGYAGIKQERRTIPIAFRMAYFPVSTESDGWMYFGEGGVGFHLDSYNLTGIFRAGTGYRLKLSRKSSLDFLASIQMSVDHPAIYNMNNAQYVPNYYVMSSNGLYGALNFSISMNF